MGSEALETGRADRAPLCPDSGVILATAVPAGVEGSGLAAPFMGRFPVRAVDWLQRLGANDLDLRLYREGARPSPLLATFDDRVGRVSPYRG